MNDIVAKEILAVLLSRKTPGNVSFTAGEMSDMILSRMDADSVDDKTRQIFGSRRVGKVFQRFGDDLHTLFAYSSRILEGKTKYDFAGLTARGQAIQATLCGGLVGFECQKPETPNDTTGAGDFAETTPPNPPHTPNTRGRGHNDSLLREEEKDNGDYPDFYLEGFPL